MSKTYDPTADPKVAELIDAMNQRMILHRAELAERLSDGYVDEHFNGMPVVQFVLREEYREGNVSPERWYYEGDMAGDFAKDTPFLGASQEEATGDTLFFMEVGDGDTWVAMDYVIDTQKLDTAIEYVKAHGDVITDAARAEDLDMWEHAG